MATSIGIGLIGIGLVSEEQADSVPEIPAHLAPYPKEREEISRLTSILHKQQDMKDWLTPESIQVFIRCQKMHRNGQHKAALDYLIDYLGNLVSKN